MMETEMELAPKENASSAAAETEKSIDSKIKELLDLEVSSDGELSSDEVLESIFEGYRIIDEIQDHHIDKYQGLKEYLVILDQLIHTLDNYKGEANVEELKQVLKDAEITINELIDSNPTDEKIASELDTILIRIEDLSEGIIGKKEEEKLPIIERRPVDFQKLDMLYRSLYKAIDANNLKKVTLYRGRIIRELKRKKEEINGYYEEIHTLDDIQKMIDSKASIEEIREVLQREENKKYYDVFKDSLSNMTQFKNAFDFIYQQLHVRKVSLYKDALKQELKDQREDLNKRYDNEFLEQKGTVGSIIKVFPNAVGLAVKGVANSIDELKEASTSRKKASKFKEVLKSIGKLVATPFIYAGKFLASNWYTLYLIRKGVLGAKAEQEAEREKKEAETRARAEAEANSREKAISSYMKAHQGVSREEAAKIVDENAKKADYDTQTRTYEDQYQANLAARGEQEAASRERAISSYMRAHQGVTREQAESAVDENAKKADYDSQARFYENEYQQNLAVRTEQEAASRERAISSYMRAHQGVTREQAESAVDENAKKADYDTQTRTYEDQYQANLVARGNQEAADRERAITNFMKAHQGVTREQAESFVDDAAKKADYDSQARFYENEYQLGLQARAEQEAASRERAISSYMRAHQGVTREQAESYVDDAAKKADYDTQTRTYDDQFQTGLQQRSDAVARDRERAISSYMRANPGTGREEAEAIVDDNSKRVGYDLQARSYEKVYQANLAHRGEVEAQDRERAISGYLNLHPDASREVAEEAVDKAARVTSYEHQARTYEDQFVDQLENDPNHYTLPKTPEEAEQMRNEATAKAEEMGVEVEPTLGAENQQPDEAPVEEPKEVPPEAHAVGPKGTNVVHEEPRRVYNREEVMQDIMKRFNYSREQAGAICDQIEQAMANPQPEATIRAMTEEEAKAIEQQQNEPQKEPSSWVLLDTNGQTLPIFIPRFMVGWFTGAGYVESDGILWHPMSVQVDQALGTGLVK